jgi:hypothetical protein
VVASVEPSWNIKSGLTKERGSQAEAQGNRASGYKFLSGKQAITASAKGSQDGLPGRFSGFARNRQAACPAFQKGLTCLAFSPQS